MDNIIGLSFLACLGSVIFFIRNILMQKEQPKVMRKIIFYTFVVYAVLSSFASGDTIADKIDLTLFAFMFGVVGVLIWKIMNHEDDAMKMFLYLLLLIPVRMLTSLASDWSDGFISILGTNAMLITGLLLITFVVGIMSKHYVVEEMVKILLGFDGLTVLLLAVDTEGGIVDKLLVLVILVVVQLPIILILRAIYRRVYLRSKLELDIKGGDSDEG